MRFGRSFRPEYSGCPGVVFINKVVVEVIGQVNR
jgi:hypothetical protein